jgi:hypothetical protein
MSHRRSLSASQEKLEWECAGLCTTVDMLKQENTQLVTACVAEVAIANKFF